LERAVTKFRKTSQEYPLGAILKDANAVHIEVALPDQELRFTAAFFGLLRPAIERLLGWGRRRLKSKRQRKRRIRRDRIGLLARLPNGQIYEATLGHFFGAFECPSPRLLHVYSTRQLREASHEDPLLPYLSILIPLRFTTSIFLAYLASVVAFLGAGGFVAYEFLHATIRHNSIDTPEVVVVVAAVAATLGLWLTSVQHPNAITNAKVLPARIGFFVALALLVVSPTVFLLVEALRRLF
jgi:hypothetical protein